MKKILYLIPFLIFIHSVAYSQAILIKPKQILDVRSGKLINADILVEAGVIKKVAKNIPIKSEYEIIDLRDMTVLPGLMDAHVHLTGNTDLKGHEGISESSYLATIYGVKNANQTLMAGFTTVRNVGASSYSDVALRDGIEQKAILGPTLLVSGPPLGITGGHCDSNILPAEYEYRAQGVADGPWEVRRKVRENKKYGVDLIKYCATGGVMSKGTNVNNRQYTLDEMKAIVDEAHTLGMKVAAHAHGLEGIRMAIDAGVDSVEHSSLIDQETINLATLCICAEAVGCMESCYHKTLEYTKGREQFGQPISGFQVLQHRMVDMFIETELTKSLMIKATLQLDSDDPEAGNTISALKVQVGKAGRLVGQHAVQLHGGMGVSNEMSIGHYLKRFTAIDSMFGNTQYHINKYKAT